MAYRAGAPKVVAELANICISKVTRGCSRWYIWASRLNPACISVAGVGLHMVRIGHLSRSGRRKLGGSGASFQSESELALVTRLTALSAFPRQPPYLPTYTSSSALLSSPSSTTLADTTTATMSSLPPELWIVTFDKLRFPGQPTTEHPFLNPLDVPTLKALTLTSRLFYALARPLLYESVRVRVGCPKDIAQILQLKDRSERSHWVKYVHIVGCAVGILPFMTMCTKFRGLRSIALDTVRVEAQWILEVLQLPSLESWTSFNIRIDGDIHPTKLPINQLRLKTVRLRRLVLGHHHTIQTPEAGFLARMALSPLLQSLDFDGPIYAVLDAAQSSPLPSNLRSFKVGRVASIDDLYEFLRRCPSITSIDVLGIGPPGLTLLPLPADVLPLLRDFTGSMLLAQLFIPDRHAVTISLCESPESDQEESFFQSLKKGSKQVKTVSIRGSQHALSLATLASTFPSLESLTIESFCPPISVCELDREVRSSTYHSLSRTFPSRILRRCPDCNPFVSNWSGRRSVASAGSSFPTQASKPCNWRWWSDLANNIQPSNSLSSVAGCSGSNPP